MSDDDEKSRKKPPSVKVVNNNQHGGVGFQQNNYFAPPARHLDDVLPWLRLNVQAGDVVRISWSANDMEAQRLAAEIISALPSMGIQVQMVSPGAGLENLRGMVMGGQMADGAKTILVCSKE